MSGIFRRKIYRRRPEQGHVYWDPYTMPILCMSTLYQRCQGNTLDTPILLKDYSTSTYPDGYPTASSGNGPISQFVADINGAVLNGSPEQWLNNSNILKLTKTGTKFYVNSVAEEDGTAIGIMEAFEVNRYSTDEQYDFFFDQVDQASHRIGYSDFRLPTPMPDARGSKNIRGSWSMSGNQDPTNYSLIPYMMYSRLYVPFTEGAAATDKYCNFTTLVWPDKVAGSVTSYATGGKWDFSKLDNIPGGTTKMICELRIEMWQRTNETGNPGTWFWAVYVVPHEISVNHWNFLNTYLQGEDTGPKYNLGDETPDDGDDPPGIPETPPDLVAAGGYNAYKISLANLPTIFNFLNSYTPLESLVKMWSDPSEGIISLHMLPFSAHVSTARSLLFHGVPIMYPVDTGTVISAPTVEQWQEWDMGTVRIPKPEDYTGYAPYANVTIFLPFIGMRQLDADEVMGTSINVQYRIDAITGSVTAWVLVNDSVRYTFAGSCACSMPLSGTDWSGVYQALGSAVMSAVTGGISTFNDSYTNNSENTSGSAGSFLKGIASGVGTGLGKMAINPPKPLYHRISNMGNTTSLNSCKEPYIILEKQDSAKPDSYKEILGNPASRSVSMGSLSGFNVIQECRLDGISATAGELNEIESLLKQGVIF